MQDLIARLLNRASKEATAKDEAKAMQALAAEKQAQGLSDQDLLSQDFSGQDFSGQAHQNDEPGAGVSDQRQTLNTQTSEEHFPMSDYATFKAMVDEHNVKYVDLRFTDPRGKLQHLTMCIEAMGEDEMNEGVMFDGSSIAGWKAINESDMVLKPDLGNVTLDPFSAQPQLNVMCDIYDPITGEGYERDPRSTAKRAEAWLKTTGIGDQIFCGPEAEFFMFDDVKFGTSEQHMNKSFYELYSEEGPYASGDEFEMGNMGHRPGVKGGYFPVNPVDSAQDIRAEMVSVAREMGLPMDKHHHEVAP